MLKYATLYCKRVPYLVKSDDDMFVHIPFLQSTLFANKSLPERSMMGACIKQPVVREGKWNVPYDIYPHDTYPLYLSGTLYIINMDIVEELFNTSKVVPLIPIEDAYVTGILSSLIKAKLVCLDKMFSYFKERSPKLCDIVKHVKIAFTQISATKLQIIWRGLFRHKCYLNNNSTTTKHVNNKLII